MQAAGGARTNQPRAFLSWVLSERAVDEEGWHVWLSVPHCWSLALFDDLHLGRRELGLWSCVPPVECAELRLFSGSASSELEYTSRHWNWKSTIHQSATSNRPDCSRWLHAVAPLGLASGSDQVSNPDKAGSLPQKITRVVHPAGLFRRPAGAVHGRWPTGGSEQMHKAGRDGLRGSDRLNRLPRRSSTLNLHRRL